MIRVRAKARANLIGARIITPGNGSMDRPNTRRTNPAPEHVIQTLPEGLDASSMAAE